ncbi:benenodin family lasso peptide [Novosphingobium kaempferiae]|nr:benenodin family lasso peptide [Novosphingobium kaempferiae]
MERQDHLEAELVDLGMVTEETKGPGPVGLDTLGPQRTQTGISDD